MNHNLDLEYTPAKPRRSQSRQLAKLLKKYKKANKITLKDLAGKAGVPMGSLAGMFAGKLPKSEEPVLRLVVVLGHKDAMITALRADRHLRGLKPARGAETFSVNGKPATAEEFSKALRQELAPLNHDELAEPLVGAVNPHEEQADADAEGWPYAAEDVLQTMKTAAALAAMREPERVPAAPRSGLFTEGDVEELLKDLPEGNTITVKREALKLSTGVSLFTIWM